MARFRFPTKPSRLHTDLRYHFVHHCQFYLSHKHAHNPKDNTTEYLQTCLFLIFIRSGHQQVPNQRSSYTSN
ncbi:hypothetical protein Hanom_Chr16g01485151 [Helianthus anomalus]